ncbi:MAG: diaminopimelate epimerase [Magnetococcales bacterium]|uniref:Diaminopimelate epimerase n=1 Tax=Candidatus Magnetobacterium casense TaxID=1455061 RepID=A0ABS6RXC8_9BACT|nr:diaminopimelate epimerase [Nitrospirota bacterium]MBV6341278.1 diaminopimelate epimerase [Candidatus Magnetobacterium casensis]
MDFVKMHGLGNDFILVDCLRQVQLQALTGHDWQSMAPGLCDRRFGVGADQILLLLPSSTSDFRMKIYNADGSEVEMCGNGIRALAKYVWDEALSVNDPLAIETLAGVIRPQRAGDLICVDMGIAQLEVSSIAVDSVGGVIGYPLEVADRVFEITHVSMGNPHTVILTGDVDGFPVARYGPLIETHKLFPNRTNVEFIEVLSRTEVRMRVWERGAGETLACGTGACAVAVATSIKGLTDRAVTVHLRGGKLHIEWRQSDGHVYMTGSATRVFNGNV